MSHANDTLRVDPTLVSGNVLAVAIYRARRVAAVTLNCPERKNTLAFDPDVELRDLFGRLRCANDVKATEGAQQVIDAAPCFGASVSCVSRTATRRASSSTRSSSTAFSRTCA